MCARRGSSVLRTGRRIGTMSKPPAGSRRDRNQQTLSRSGSWMPKLSSRIVSMMTPGILNQPALEAEALSRVFGSGTTTEPPAGTPGGLKRLIYRKLALAAHFLDSGNANKKFSGCFKRVTRKSQSPRVIRGPSRILRLRRCFI